MSHTKYYFNDKLQANKTLNLRILFSFTKLHIEVQNVIFLAHLN